MPRITIITCLMSLLVGASAVADDDVPFLHFTLADPLPESVIGSPIDDTEVELESFRDGVVIEGETSGLLPYHAYTIWALVFNNPDGCNDGCQIADDIGPDSGFAALWTGIGFVADEDGEAEFETVMLEGEPAGEVLMGEGLTDARDAEIHLIIRYHGPAAFDDPELLEAQITTFGGGCEEFGCDDVQYAILGRSQGDDDDDDDHDDDDHDDDDDDDEHDGDDDEEDEFEFLEFMIGSPLETSTSGNSVEDSEIRFEKFDEGFYIEAETAGLEPGHTYTIWAGVFNDPDECEGSCDITDFGVEGWSILWTGVGLIADDDGELEFEAIVIEGEPAGEIVTGPGLIDIDNAEIHLFIRSHGPASDDPAVLEEQLTMLMGGCDLYGCDVPQYAVLNGGD
ncbi:MAG: hypothetical protein VX764_06720 [Planctomycetota bacterium]|nr:hypothetical protein [Planctomycetota bacterium]